MESGSRPHDEPPLTMAVRVALGSSGEPIGHVLGGDGSPQPLVGRARPGAVVLAERRAGELHAGAVIAEPDTAMAKLYGIAEAHGLTPIFPPEVAVEVRALKARPGIDAADLEDWTNKPFITIDHADSRDLDQAMLIERRRGGGFEVFYALADAAHYVRPGSALHAEAMRRGVTHYFPGFSIPMLPPELSEGIVSLNPGSDRRAFAVVTRLDARGEVVKTRFVRARIRSRAKLSYEAVQAFHDGIQAELGGRDFTETLVLLGEVGALRMSRSSEHDVVQLRRDEVRASLDPDDPTGFVLHLRGRNRVESWNEQISLLCNSEGAEFLRSPGNAPWVTPIYRVHPRPLERRVADFDRLVQGVVSAQGLEPEVWGWDRAHGESLADYLAKLPFDGPRAGIARALHRQAVMINQASSFSAEPGEHHGIGVEPYARFSSPMREMVGVYTHKEALEKLSGAPPPGWVRASEATRAEMVELANRTKARQRTIEKAADKLVLDRILGSDLERPKAQRATWAGTILGVTAKKVYMRVDDPPIELKLDVPDLERRSARLVLAGSGALLRSTDPRVLPDLRLGDPIAVHLTGYEPRRGRYRFALSA